jgi:hypothetical protein
MPSGQTPLEAPHPNNRSGMAAIIQHLIRSSPWTLIVLVFPEYSKSNTSEVLCTRRIRMESTQA